LSEKPVGQETAEKEFILISINFKKIAATAALGMFAVLGCSVVANAQGNSNKGMKNERKAAKQALKLEQQRARYEAQRQAEWQRRNTRLVYVPSGNDRSHGEGYYNGNANANTNRDGRYRVYRNGAYYNTNAQGADILRQAVNEGYRQGFEAGRNDRNSRRRGDWSTSNVYRTGTSGYQTQVDRGQYQYYFRQGFQRGYQDGSNSQYDTNYNGNDQYGSNQGGSLNILNAILGSILNIQSY
jgi:type II secretory pathway pseudopilin PulG